VGPWREQVHRLRRDVYLVAYVLSPIDLIPDFVPVLPRSASHVDAAPGQGDTDKWDTRWSLSGP
jgi:Protein of unknown function (DUF1232)